MRRLPKDTIFAIPEVFARVAHYLPLWERDPGDAEEEYDWRPKDLISCSRVNSTWNSIVLPIIYHTYDDDLMRQIPIERLVTIAPYFRIFDATAMSAERQAMIGPHLTTMTRLYQLEIFCHNTLLCSILLANPGLKVLKLYGLETVAWDRDEDEDEDMDHSQEQGQNAANANANANTYISDKDGSMPHIMDVADMLENLWDLRTFMLRDFDVDGTTLYRVIKKMTLLNALELQQCAGSLDIPVDAEDLPIQDFTIMDGDEHSSCDQLLSRFPNLKKFSIRVDHEGHNARRASNILITRCPQLLALHLSSSFELWMVQMITNASNHMNEFRLSMNAMTPEFTNALLARSERLVTVELISYGGDGPDLDAYLAILTRCPNLEVFRAATPIASIDVSDIFAEPWRCSELRAIEFQLIEEYNIPTQPIPKRWSLSREQNRFVVHGPWTETFSEEARSTRQVPAFHARLLQHVASMPKMRAVIVNDSRYTLSAVGQVAAAAYR